jgi:hypothetical protein
MTANEKNLAKARKAKAKKAAARARARDKARLDYKAWLTTEKEALELSQADPGNQKLKRAWLRLWHDEPIAALRQAEREAA